MRSLFSKSVVIAVLSGAATGAHAAGDVASMLIGQYATQAKQENAVFPGFSAQQGKAFFLGRHGNESCTGCHTDNLKASGKHAKTGKVIEPLAPVANPIRLSDPAKVEKWFKRNCNDVLQRACTAQEKGDVMTWLVSIK